MQRTPAEAPAGRSLFVFACALCAALGAVLLALAPPRFAHADPAPQLAPPLPTASPAPPAPPPLPPLATQRVTLPDDLARTIEVYPPTDGQPGAGMVVFLHATCMDPRPVCDLLGNTGRVGSFLVCPSGNATCAGAPDWHGTGAEKAAFLAQDLAKVEARFNRYLAHDDTLVGWSRGAFAARDILYDEVARGVTPHFNSLVIVAADVGPDPVRLRAAGIRRVLFAGGDRDGARIAMQRAAVKLAAAGITTRYDSLGPVGHWLPDDFEARLAPGIAWIRQK
ncbi:MAG: hypothetical protein ABI193_22560 [Minicystis sp.]